MKETIVSTSGNISGEAHFQQGFLGNPAFRNLSVQHADTPADEHAVCVRPPRRGTFRRHLHHAQQLGAGVCGGLPAGRLHGHPAHLPGERFSHAPHPDFAPLFVRDAAERRFDGRDDVARNARPGRDRRGGAYHGAFVRLFLGQPRFPRPEFHRRLQPQLLLRSGKFLQHRRRGRRTRYDRGVSGRHGRPQLARGKYQPGL